LVMACRPEWLLQDRIDRIMPPRAVFFMKPHALGLGLIDLDPNLPMYTDGKDGGEVVELPPLFSRCTLTNSGRLPIVAIEVPIHVDFYPATIPPSFHAESSEDGVIRVPSLESNESFSFAVASGSEMGTRFQFGKRAEATRVDTEQPGSITLLKERGVLNAENPINRGFKRPPVPKARPTKRARSGEWLR
jgi:hypothetical protein